MYVSITTYLGPSERIAEAGKILLDALSEHEGFIEGEVFKRTNVPGGARFGVAVTVIKWRSREDREDFVATGADDVVTRLSKAFGEDAGFYAENRADYELAAVKSR